MNQPQNNKPVSNKIPLILIGSMCGFGALLAVESGEIGGRRSSIIFEAQDPFLFWIGVGLFVGIALFCFYRVVKSVKK
jgi:hypothetical protein